ncbi:transposase [Streptomyces sp. NPDC001137]|uniref:transposase n=1 Tax=Streptomyces sp. NPDC001137 TaxID=3154378 RepID=UPI003325F09F
MRQRRPEQKLCVVLDNLCPHKHAAVRTWAADHDVERVFLPTHSPFLNAIESEFAALRCVALHGPDHRTHAERTPPSPPPSAGATPTPNQDPFRARVTDPPADR